MPGMQSACELALSHDAQGLSWHAASVHAHAWRSQAGSCRCHQGCAAGNVATAGHNGPTRALDQASHCQVSSHLHISFGLSRKAILNSNPALQAQDGACSALHHIHLAQQLGATEAKSL